MAILTQTNDNVAQSFSPEKATTATNPGFSSRKLTNALIKSKRSAGLDLQEVVASYEVGAVLYIIDIDENSSDKGSIVFVTSKFYIETMSFSDREKAQVLETFTGASVSFFGDTAHVYNFSGKAIDHPSNINPHTTMQQSSLTKLYREELRGTQLVKKKRIALLKILNHSIWGYPLNLNVNYSTGSEKVASFNMSWIVTKHSQTSTGLFNEANLASNYSLTQGTLSDEIRGIMDTIKKFRESLKNLVRLDVLDNDSATRLQSTSFAVKSGDTVSANLLKVATTSDLLVLAALLGSSAVAKSISDLCKFLINSTATLPEDVKSSSLLSLNLEMLKAVESNALKMIDTLDIQKVSDIVRIIEAVKALDQKLNIKYNSLQAGDF